MATFGISQIAHDKRPGAYAAIKSAARERGIPVRDRYYDVMYVPDRGYPKSIASHVFNTATEARNYCRKYAKQRLGTDTVKFVTY